MQMAVRQRMEEVQRKTSVKTQAMQQGEVGGIN